MLNSIRCSFVALFLVAFSAAAMAATTVPYTFTAGTPAKASEVNADFQALATAIDAQTATINTLAARVSKLEGQITASDLVGTYVSDSFSVRLNINSGTGMTDVRVYKATVTLAADGTGTMTNNSEKGAMLEIASSPPPLTLTPVNASIPTQPFNWHLSGSSMIIDTWSMTFSIVSGGRVLVGTTNDTISGDVTNTVWLLTRTQ